MIKQLFLVLLVLFISTAAQAGPLDDLVGQMTGLTDLAWWVQFVTLVSAVAALLSAVLPLGNPGGKWEKIRMLLNAFAANWGNAKNRDE